MTNDFSDTVEMDGLSVLLDEDDPPFLDLTLRCRGRTFRAAVLLAGEEWTLNVRDERGKSCPGSGEVYATQAGAILAAALTALALTET